MKPLIRPFLTILVGVLVAFGIIPESAQEAVIDHGSLLLGSVLALWGIVAGARNVRDSRKESVP